MANTNSTPVIPPAGIIDEPHHPLCGCSLCKYDRSTPIVEMVPQPLPAAERQRCAAKPINWNDPDIMMEFSSRYTFRSSHYDEQFGWTQRGY